MIKKKVIAKKKLVTKSPTTISNTLTGKIENAVYKVLDDSCISEHEFLIELIPSLTRLLYAAKQRRKELNKRR
jgi:hypothetical protein